ncbi:hypothetical protein TWF694_008944 [Orbilia ellipsospora]|uniref:Rhamnogalacturonase A/B/Epimerase-like pectate lyase domain-containing protein n=1 Tax=Orbilia ellipsospora TaxID=2528407 RepID=A0AAV9XDI1_9PEZI
MKLLCTVLTLFLTIFTASEGSALYEPYYHPHGELELRATLVVPQNTSASSTPDVAAALKLVQEQQIKQGKYNVNRLKHPLRNRKTTSPNRRVQGKHGNFTDTLPANVRNAVKVVAKDYAKKRRSQNGHTHAKRDAFWMEGVAHGSVAIGGSAGYVVFRNVKDYGAKGDGATDDTVAINLAISDGNRCGDNCGSSTVKPALVYFPSGTYIISSPIIQYYNTQLIGNAATPPTIKGSSAFIGLGLISSDVYIPGASGGEWYINQNNFLRQIRNFIIDTTSIPNVMAGQTIAPAGIHWQVAQVGNKLTQNAKSDTTHVGIFMENGSGGFMTDVTINGGATGAQFGNQQFTVRNFVFNNCRTAVQMIWDWAFTMESFTINNCGIGFNALGGADGTGPGSDQGTGSVTIVDTVITNTGTAVLATISGANATSILLDNVKFSGVTVGVSNNGATVLAGGSTTIASWGTGRFYNNLDQNGVGTSQSGGALPVSFARPAPLQGSNGWFQRSKPQYQTVAASGFLNVRSMGAKGDGVTDDTAALNSALSSAASAGQILWIPYGTYIITNTVVIPPGSRVVGEIWPQLMAKGANFADQTNPIPMIRVGTPGSTGTVELQDLMFTVQGATAGAILVEWNIKETTQGGAALWDCHFRVGGAIGSNLQAANCPKQTGAVINSCIAASLLLHITGSGYFENMWAWSADHDIDLTAQTQLDVYSGRGILIESSGPLWLYGTAAEHCVLYQYQIQNSADILLAMIQTESPYFQGAPIGAPTPFGPPAPATSAPSKRDGGMAPDELMEEYLANQIKIRALWKRSNQFTASDPSFSACSTDVECTVSWAIRILASSDIAVYGAGLYSWFQNYDQTCLATDQCQRYLAYVDEEKSTRVAFYNLVGVGASVMLTTLDGIAAYASDNQNGFGSTVLGFFITATNPSSGIPNVLGAYGNLLGPYGLARGVQFGDFDSGQNPTQVAGSGNALVIASTTRYYPVDTSNHVLGSDVRYQFYTAYEYWTIQDQTSLNCNEVTNGFDDLAASEPLGNGPGSLGGIYPRPNREVPFASLYNYLMFGSWCKFVKDYDVGSANIKSWDYVNEGSRVGYLHCDNNDLLDGVEPTNGYLCVKPKQPYSQFGGYYCSGVIYLQTAVCYLPANDIEGRGQPPTNPSSDPMSRFLLRTDLDLTPDFFSLTIRRQDLYQPNRQLFYTRRINQQRGQEGLSETAVDFALTRRLQTIWEGWPSRRLDGNAAGHYDFYDVTNPNSFLAFIRQTIFTPGLEDDANQNFYFRGMSTEFAMRARGIVYVMTEDPLHIPEVGIWHNVEFPTLTRAGTPVTQIVAVDETGSNWWYIWDANDRSVSPSNPRRAPPAPPRKKKKKRGFVRLEGYYTDIGGNADTSPGSYAATCMSGLQWLYMNSCPPPEAEIYTRDYEKTPGSGGHADFFG